MEDEPEEDRSSPAGASTDKSCNSSEKSYNSSDKSYSSIDKANEKAFGSASSSSSSSTLSAAVPIRHSQPPDLADVHHEHQKVFLSL